MEISRLLQNGSMFSDDDIFNQTGSPPGMNAYRDPEGRDFLEFVGFLAWYVLLIVCCIIPPCLAYRRRRSMDRVTIQQREYLQRMTDHVLMFGGAAGGLSDNGEVSEEYRMERSRRIMIALKATTVTVLQESLVKKEMEETSRDATPESVSKQECAIETDDALDIANDCTTMKSNSGGKIDKGIASEVPDCQNGSMLVEQEEPSTMLQLGDIPNGNRQVPASCAICLCGYDEGDSVVVSPNEHCIHAFHTECAVTWLSKKIEPLCPCCRQEFCDVDGYASQRMQLQQQLAYSLSPGRQQLDEEEGAASSTLGAHH